jgi:hypothetical protein
LRYLGPGIRPGLFVSNATEIFQIAKKENQGIWGSGGGPINAPAAFLLGRNSAIEIKNFLFKAISHLGSTTLSRISSLRAL